ncbi:hypothetical protein ABDK09_04935 [Vibrio sp. CDRSL-10 TSBA]
MKKRQDLQLAAKRSIFDQLDVKAEGLVSYCILSINDFYWLKWDAVQGSGYGIFASVTQKNVKYQTCRKEITAYNAENRSVCQRSGFFVSAKYSSLPTWVLRILQKRHNL